MKSTKNNKYCIHSIEQLILKKQLIGWPTPTDTQERFHFPCNKTQILLFRNV